jgi:hypothetical protein
MSRSLRAIPSAMQTLERHPVARQAPAGPTLDPREDQKRKNFKRILQPRMRTVIKDMKLLHPLADKQRYGNPLWDQDAEKIYNQLLDAVEEVAQLFKHGRGAAGDWELDAEPTE